MAAFESQYRRTLVRTSGAASRCSWWLTDRTSTPALMLLLGLFWVPCWASFVSIRTVVDRKRTMKISQRILAGIRRSGKDVFGLADMVWQAAGCLGGCGALGSVFIKAPILMTSEFSKSRRR